MYRVKKVLEAFGVDVRGEIEIEPHDLVNLQAQVRVEPEEREDPLTGRRQVRMRVPYLGYAPLARAHGEDEVDTGGLAPVDARSAGGEPLRDGADGDEDGPF